VPVVETIAVRHGGEAALVQAMLAAAGTSSPPRSASLQPRRRRSRRRKPRCGGSWNWPATANRCARARWRASTPS
jgi:hypothetical protein